MFGLGGKRVRKTHVDAITQDGFMHIDWSIDSIQDPNYRAKFVSIPDIIEDWLTEWGGISGKDLLEFGCGKGTMALSMAIRKEAHRVVGVDVLDVYQGCLPQAQQEIGLRSLPGNLEFRQIIPGQELEQLGKFDVIYTWSVVEHIAQDMLVGALASIKTALKPKGSVFLQISPLYFSAGGSHLAPWVPEPWAHLSMQHDMYHQSVLSAGATPPHIREEWAVYVPLDADIAKERQALWETYVTLNKLTAPQLCRLVAEAGFEIIRDHRTQNNADVPPHLAEIYNIDVLTTQQIVLLLRHAR